MRKVRIMEHISPDGVILHDNVDLLPGRRTYDAWATFWPTAGDFATANGPNAALEYVATHRPGSLERGPVADLGSDSIDGIRAVKDTDGPELIACGSSTLTSVLLDQGLADEVVLLVYPVLLGRGKRFFSESVDPRELAIVSSQATSTGVLPNTCRHVGPLQA